MFEKLVRWTPKNVSKWEHTRQAGRKRYVWRIGVLGWGGLMFVAMTPFFYAQQYGAVWPSAEDFPVLLILVLASAATWMIGGYWFGSTMWSTMERAYRRHQGESIVTRRSVWR